MKEYIQKLFERERNTSGDSESQSTKPKGDKHSKSEAPEDPEEPSDSSSDEEDDAKKKKRKRDKKLFIQPGDLKKMKFNFKSVPRCDVPLFERGKDLTIDNWVRQMETHIKITRIPPDTWIGITSSRIALAHYEEISALLDKGLSYIEFRE